MAITRAQVEQILIRRCGKKLALVGLDGVTQDGSNTDLSDPIASTLAILGLAVANVALVADADLVAVQACQAGALVDIAELRVLESVLGNWDQADQMADTDNSQSLGKLYDSLEKTVARKRLQLQRQYGFGVGELTAGVYDLGFAETVDFATERPQ